MLCLSGCQVNRARGGSWEPSIPHAHRLRAWDGLGRLRCTCVPCLPSAADTVTPGHGGAAPPPYTGRGTCSRAPHRISRQTLFHSAVGEQAQGPSLVSTVTPHYPELLLSPGRRQTLALAHLCWGVGVGVTSPPEPVLSPDSWDNTNNTHVVRLAG